MPRIQLNLSSIQLNQRIVAVSMPNSAANPKHTHSGNHAGPGRAQRAALPVVPMASGMGDALIGGDFLRGRRVWVSFSTQQLFLAPLEHGPWLAVTRTDETPALSPASDNFLQENSATVPIDVVEDPHRR